MHSMQQPEFGYVEHTPHTMIHPRPQSSSHRLPPLNIPDPFDNQFHQYPSSHYPNAALGYSDATSPSLAYYSSHENQSMDSLRHRGSNIPLNPNSSYPSGHGHSHGSSRQLPPPFPPSSHHAPSINIPSTDWNMPPGARDVYLQNSLRSPGASDPYSNVDYGVPQGQAMAPEPSLKKKRKRADAYQLRVLNDVYARTAFPSTDERNALARQLDMTPRSVQIW